MDTLNNENADNPLTRSLRATIKARGTNSLEAGGVSLEGANWGERGLAR